MSGSRYNIALLLIVFGFSVSLMAEEVADGANEAGAGFKASATRGGKTFQLLCAHCHNTSYEESRVGAPGLKGVLERHDEKWLNQWLQSPEAFAKKDETAADLLDSNKYGLKMPTLPEMQNNHHRADIIAYLKTLKGD